MTPKATAMEAVELPSPHVLEGHYRDHSDKVNGYSELQIRAVLASLAASQAEVVVLRAALIEARWAVAAFVREIKPEHATNPLPDSVLARIDAALTQGAQS